MPTCVPDDVTRDGVAWSADWTELQWDHYFEMKAVYEREWRDQQMQRLAEIALQIDRDQREQALFAEQEKVDLYWKQEVEQNAKLREVFQKLLDKPAYDKLVERTRRAGLAIRRDDAQIERAALLRRGVLKGRRG
jgi:hypothetical protein